MLRLLMSRWRLFWQRLCTIGGKERVLACRDVIAQISDFLDEELDPSVMRQIQTHLDICVLCRAFLESLDNTSRLLRLDPSEPLPEDAAQQMIDHLQQAYEAHKRRSKRVE